MYRFETMAHLPGSLRLAEEFKVLDQNGLPIDQMSFSEIADYVGRINDQTVIAHGRALTRRLYEIALYDHHVHKSHREGAFQLLRQIKRTMEIHYEDSPDSLTIYREVNALMEENARRVGVGSLVWLVLEKGPMSDEEFVRFVTLPKHRELLPNFFSILGSELAMRLNKALTQTQPKQHRQPVNGVGRFILAVLGAIAIVGVFHALRDNSWY
jgi:hypothetical protein